MFQFHEVQVPERERRQTYLPWFNLLKCNFSCFGCCTEQRSKCNDLCCHYVDHLRMHLSNWNCGSHSEMPVKIKLDPPKRWNRLELCSSWSCWGPAPSLNSAVAESHFRVWLCTSHCQSFSREAEQGKGALPLCFMQMKHLWLSAMQQPIAINKHFVSVNVCISFCKVVSGLPRAGLPRQDLIMLGCPPWVTRTKRLRLALTRLISSAPNNKEPGQSEKKWSKPFMDKRWEHDGMLLQ